jgi:hypothetical protein
MCSKKKQTSITNHYPKKVAAVSVEFPGNKAQHREEAPPDPTKKQHHNMNWNSDDSWPALYEAPW